MQQDFGCAALARLPKLYGTDEEIIKNFQGFQKACMWSVQKAKITKEVLAAQAKEKAKEEAAA